MKRHHVTVACLFLLASPVFAGTGYQVTAKDGDEIVTYMVKFGGGRAFQQHTAYDPVTKGFVYATWRRGAAAPEPVASVWDHVTGRTIDLYEFPKAKHPLPVIPSIKAMKVCPKTGDPDFESKAVLAYD